MDKQDENLHKAKEKLGLLNIKHHLFLCAGASDPKCCSYETGMEVFEHLKKRLDELGLSKQGVLRSKASCLRVCVKGPILAVYPEGIWYHSVDAALLDRIIDEHIIGQKPIKEYIINAKMS